MAARTFRSLESRRRQQGYRLIAGVDEVGRGALAGPLIAAAVILRPWVRLPHLKDSKALTRLQRERFAKQILAGALAFGYGQVSPVEIDRGGIAAANDLVFRLALDALRPRPSYALADYFSVIGYRCPVEGVRGGDVAVRSIAAASVIAKVYRDSLMTALAIRYPNYGFATHVGYGTAAHEAAIRNYGLSPIHRRSFCTKFAA